MYVVILQLAMAEAMPLPQFIATSIVIASGLILNFMKYFRLLNPEIWHFWEEFITIAGLSALPQVILSVTERNCLDLVDSYEPSSILLMVFTVVHTGHVVNFCSLHSKYCLSWPGRLCHCSACCSYGEHDVTWSCLNASISYVPKSLRWLNLNKLHCYVKGESETTSGCRLIGQI